MSAIVNIACIWRQPGFDKGDRIWNSASTFRARVRTCVRICGLSLLRKASWACSGSFSLSYSHPLSVTLSRPLFVFTRVQDTPGCALFLSATTMNKRPWSLRTSSMSSHRSIINHTSTLREIHQTPTVMRLRISGTRGVCAPSLKAPSTDYQIIHSASERGWVWYPLNVFLSLWWDQPAGKHQQILSGGECRFVSSVDRSPTW